MEFPSPLGASYFQILPVWVYNMGFVFPSPLGASYFQIGLTVALVAVLNVSVPSRGILFPNRRWGNTLIQYTSFRPLSGHLISKYVLASRFYDMCDDSFRPLSGHLISKWHVEVANAGIHCSFHPLSGHLISKYCLPEPAILLAFLTLLRGKSFSCIFFLYLTYTIASKCSIYAVRGKIINCTNTIWTAILLFRINLFFFYFLKYSHS